MDKMTFEATRREEGAPMFNAQRWAEDHGETLMTRSEFDREEELELERENLRAEMLAEEYALERAHPTFTVIFSADELDWLLDELLPMLAEHRRDIGYLDRPDILHSINQWRMQAGKQGYVSSGSRHD